MISHRQDLPAGRVASRKGVIAAGVAAAAMMAFFFPRAVSAQTALTDSLQLRGEDAGKRSTTIVLGYHPAATEGFDVEFSEMPVPPVPAVQAFDFRFVDRKWLHREPATGTYADVRPLRATADADTFFVRLQPQNEAFPVRISWDSRQISAYAEATIVIAHADGTRTVDMRASTAATFGSDADPVVRIILKKRKKAELGSRRNVHETRRGR